MDIDPARFGEHVHGHLGWLAAAALVHPAIVLRSKNRRAHLAVGLAASFVTIAGALGAVVYVAYRERLRTLVFQSSPFVGLLMERKEHLAFGAIVLAWAGTAAYVAAPRAAAEATRIALRTIAFRSFCASAALAIVVAVIGTAVAIHTSF